MQDRYIAAVDLGSSKISLSVAKIEGKDIQVHYYREIPSEGISRSAIQRPTKVSSLLRELIDDANEELGIKIMQVVVSLPRYRVDQEQSSARVTRTNPETAISGSEVNDFIETASSEYNFTDSDNRKIYGTAPQSFSVEEQGLVSENDVIGVYSDYIEGHFTFFLGQKKPIKNITYTLNEINMALAKVVFVPPTTANAVLTEDEIESGVALIEIGSDISSVSIYKGKRLKYYGSIPFGGKSITNDIKNECGFSFKLAENLKIAYGSCTPNNLFTLSEKIIQITNESGSYDRISVKYLAEIIQERCKEIIDALLYMIEESGFSQDLRKGVVLTGGGSKLSGLKSLFSEMSGYDVRFGYARSSKFWVGNSAIAAKEMSASANMGMILFSQRFEKLNCINEMEIEEETLESSEETIYPENERQINPGPKTNDGDELPFGGFVQPTEKKKGTKKGKGEKPSVHWFSMIVDRVGIGIEKTVEATVGSIYDQMEE